MFTAGDCALKCVDTKPFIYTVVNNQTKIDIKDIKDYKDKTYCVQLSTLTSDSGIDCTMLESSDLKDAIVSHYYEQQNIADTFIGFNTLPDTYTVASSNEDVFNRDHYDQHHMNYRINARYATSDESDDPKNSFVSLDPTEISKISIGNYYIDSEHFEYSVSYPFTRNNKNFHFKYLIQLGMYFVIFEFVQNTMLMMRFATYHKGKFDIFYDYLLYDFINDYNELFEIKVENKYDTSTKITLNLGENSDTPKFEIEEFILPFSKCSVISNMYVEYRGAGVIDVKSNFYPNSSFLTNNPTHSDKLLKFDISNDTLQSTDKLNIIVNAGCKFEFNDKNVDKNLDLTLGKINSTIPTIHLLTGDKLKLYNDKTLHLDVSAQSVLFKNITLVNQSDYVQSDVFDNETEGYHSLQFKDDKTYLALYKYQWNDIPSCYGFRERFTFRGLELFKRIEAYSAFYSIHAINFVVSTNLDSIFPISNNVSPDIQGNSFQSTNIIPLTQIDDVKYFKRPSYRHIEIHGTLQNLRDKFDIGPGVKYLYLSSISIVYLENARYFELSSNANHTLKVIDVDKPLPIILDIEY